MRAHWWGSVAPQWILAIRLPTVKQLGLGWQHNHIKRAEIETRSAFLLRRRVRAYKPALITIATVTMRVVVMAAWRVISTLCALVVRLIVRVGITTTWRLDLCR